MKTPFHWEKSLKNCNKPTNILYSTGMPGLLWWLSWWRIHLQWGRPGLDPWVGKIPWRRERLPTSVFWPGKFLWLYGPWGHKELDMTLVTFTFTFQRDSKIRNTSSSNDKLPSVSIMSVCFMNWDSKIQSEMCLTCNTEDPRKQPQVCSEVWSV